ncbi:MAG: DUF1345 domain-containing protein [Nostochopsis sp.]
MNLHYATCYYRPEQISQGEEYTKGLDFPGEEEPNYWDFMYFSFTLGMTAQTSDVSITSLLMRQLVLGHAIVSFHKMFFTFFKGCDGGISSNYDRGTFSRNYS